MPLDNIQPQGAPSQFGGGHYTQMINRNYQSLSPMTGGRGSSQMPAGLGRSVNSLGGGMPGWNSGWGQQNLGGQGYPAPGYPPQGFGQQQPQMRPMPHSQSYPFQSYPFQGYPTQSYPTQSYPFQGYPTQGYPTQSYPTQGYPTQGYPTQGYPTQGYAPQGYNQGYGGQMPVQPAWEGPKKGGIKGFISNLMAKRKM